MLAATIVAIFPALDNFFGAVTAKLSRPQRRHFYAYLLALTISSGLRKTISAACSLKRFLTHAPADDQALRRAYWQQVRHQIEQTATGGCGYLIIDDTPVAKTGHHIAGTCGHRLDAKPAYWGHRFVSALYVYGPYKVPLGYRLYCNKRHCQTSGRLFKSKIELALELLADFVPPCRVSTVVLFDCWYNAPAMIHAVRRRGFYYVTRVRRSRHVGRHGHLQDIAQWTAQHRHWRRPLAVPGRSYLGYSRILRTKKLGRQKFAIIYDLEATQKAPECIYLMSSLLTAQAATVARHYLHRTSASSVEPWKIETAYHDTKQLLGLGDYQTRLRAVALRRAKARALSGVYRHLLMVDVAYTALRLQGVQSVGTSPENSPDRPLTLGKLKRPARQRTVLELVKHIISEHQKGASPDQIAQSLPINI